MTIGSRTTGHARGHAACPAARKVLAPARDSRPRAARDRGIERRQPVPRQECPLAHHAGQRRGHPGRVPVSTRTTGVPGWPLSQQRIADSAPPVDGEFAMAGRHRTSLLAPPVVRCISVASLSPTAAPVRSLPWRMGDLPLPPGPLPDRRLVRPGRVGLPNGVAALCWPREFPGEHGDRRGGDREGSGSGLTSGRHWRAAGGGPRPRRRDRTQKPVSAAAPTAATASVVASPLRGTCSS